MVCDDISAFHDALCCLWLTQEPTCTSYLLSFSMIHGECKGDGRRIELEAEKWQITSGARIYTERTAQDCNQETVSHNQGANLVAAAKPCSTERDHERSDSACRKKEQEHHGPVLRRTLLTPGLARWSSRLARGPLPVTIAWTKNPNLRRRQQQKQSAPLSGFLDRGFLNRGNQSSEHTWRTWPDVHS